VAVKFQPVASKSSAAPKAINWPFLALIMAAFWQLLPHDQLAK